MLAFLAAFVAIASVLLQNVYAAHPSIAETPTSEKNKISCYTEALKYAYMDISTADPSTKELILIARDMIIHSTSWVSDDVNGRIGVDNGKIIYELPHFHDIFPEDWDEPIYPTE